MAIPRKKVKDADDFIGGAKATKADNSKKKVPAKKNPKFLLDIPLDLRNALNIEVMGMKDKYPNVSTYICAILEQRNKLKL